jgi:cyclomaltodextrinase / maltogenic alpha-amylase / neopullulanase
MSPLALALVLLLPKEKPMENEFARRERDWRNGAIVYQIFVDRFAPSANLEAKRDLYAPPRTLAAWSQPMKRGREIRKEGLWTHEVVFYGGDLASVRSKVGYLRELGADVVYLNPIHAAFTAHKYDASDWAAVAPEYGTRQDVIALAKDLHAGGMKLMLDGVFNHVGRRNPKFQDALTNPKSAWRDWFYIDTKYPAGYRAWANVANLAEVNLDNAAVRNHLWNGNDSVVTGYLRDGVDGWRLDVAYDLGYEYLRELTQAAHRAKPGSAVVGEIWNYPEGWFDSLDGIYNMFAGETILRTVRGQTNAAQAGKWLERMIADGGTEPMLKSWIVLDNHDVPRLRHQLPDKTLRHLAQGLQFTLPGSPVIYYGTELGMEGGGDPENRHPMRWDLATPDNADLAWVKKLIALRKANRALRIGDFRLLDTEKLMAFARITDRALETVVVALNPTDVEIRDTVPVREGRLMNYSGLQDALTGAKVLVASGFVHLKVPPKTLQILTLPRPDVDKYTPYKRLP